MRLSHITIQCANIARSREFYLKLGFEPVVDEAHYCRFRPPGDAASGLDGTFSIEHHEGVIRPAAHIGLEYPSPEALDSDVARLKAEGVAVAEGPIDRSWLWRDARILDPDGHELMLFYAGKNKLDPPWKVQR